LFAAEEIAICLMAIKATRSTHKTYCSSSLFHIVSSLFV